MNKPGTKNVDEIHFNFADIRIPFFFPCPSFHLSLRTAHTSISVIFIVCYFCASVFAAFVCVYIPHQETLRNIELGCCFSLCSVSVFYIWVLIPVCLCCVFLLPVLIDLIAPWLGTLTSQQQDSGFVLEPKESSPCVSMWVVFVLWLPSTIQSCILGTGGLVT